MIRENAKNHIMKFRQLFHQDIVDTYVCENRNMNFLHLIEFNAVAFIRIDSVT